MVLSREELEEAVIAAMNGMYRASPRPSMEPWLGLDLTTAQIKTLAVLCDSERVTIGQAAEMLGITLPTASHLVEKLVRAGFVERYEDPLDRRRTVAQPTTQGVELVRSFREFGVNYLRSCLTHMNDADIAALAQGMRGLAEAASAVKNEPTAVKEPEHV